MKIVCLLGSPRLHGNSAAIARHLCETAEKLGAQVRTFALNELTYRGCQGCMACKTKLDRCILEDDLSEVLEAVMEADVLVMASPVYFGELSSQLKGFVDRTFSYLVPDFIVNPKKSRLAPGKTVIFILAQGNPDEQAFADIFPRYDYFYKGRGFDCSRLIRVCGVRDAGEVNGRKDVLTLAENTARQLFDGGACPQ